MNEIDRTNRRVELEVEYNKCLNMAHGNSRDGLAYHLMAARAQYEPAKLALTPAPRLAHESTARTHEALVRERKKTLGITDAPTDTSRSSDAPPKPLSTSELIASIEEHMAEFNKNNY